MISLAYRDISNTVGRYVLTGIGLGLLIGVTLTMAGVFRGMVDDGRALLRAADADIWVVQQNTLGPFAEPSSLPDDIYRGILAIDGVTRATNVAYLTLEVSHAGRSVRVMLEGIEPGQNRLQLTAGRPVTRSHYELVADERSGFRVGDLIPVHRHVYRVVGLTRGMRSPSGDPILFLPLKDAQEIQFLKDNDALFRDRRLLEDNPRLNPPGNPALLGGLEDTLFSNHRVNTVLVQLAPGVNAQQVATDIEQWLRLTAYPREEMEQILIGQLIAMASRQIGLFLVILTVVSAAIVALTVYSMTQTKLKEIAVLKLIGTPNSLISRMILLEAIGLGLIGFLTGKLAVTYWAPLFPKHVLLLTEDTLRALIITLVICILASVAGIRAALRIPPGSAIGG
ncbi:putative ABC transport system permease protein [Thiogranum longum]|uniref:Putative ABC transport system permease protein n=1 Tax=Thiogranum longum TaxID=1537524 RepID=A0A4R1HCP9_9GAMM|nr:ABC transporter permease [Thiogranum longum]TCK17990.1 putative ABC transport system permease protein [Thiogranum longum]